MENTKNVFYVIKYCCFGTDYKEEEINSFYCEDEALNYLIMLKKTENDNFLIRTKEITINNTTLNQSSK